MTGARVSPINHSDGSAADDPLATVLTAAQRAAPLAAAAAPADRASWLEAVAQALEEGGDELIPVAERETGIATARLRGELVRTVGQLRLFADVCREGSYLEVMIDNENAAANPVPLPEVRRMLVPLGPVAVFAASNFPFAFSVAGGDTASALAAGCPVIVKAHPGHPDLSERTGIVVRDALKAAGAPEGLFDVVSGTALGRRLVAHPVIQAVGFTGSLAGGRALFDVAAARPDPIPFYGELGSLNPCYVTPGAAQDRPDLIATGFVASFTTSAGQLCTKPGLLFVPAGSPIADLATAKLASVTANRLLTENIAQGFATTMDAWRRVPGIRILSGFTEGDPGSAPAPTLASTDVPTLLAHQDPLLQEAFGPAALVVEYADTEQLMAAAAAVPASLAAAVFADPADPEVPALQALLGTRAGRLCWNSWPTGVAVIWSMQHGGPYPATTSPLHTSVGPTAIRRWLRPLAFQGWPLDLVPPALREPSTLPRRVDGHLVEGPGDIS